MNKKLLALSLAAILAAPAAFAVDDHDDTQTVNVTVPKVRLLAISDAAVNLVLVKPSNAGGGFVDVSDASTTYKISSNVDKLGTGGKTKISAQVAGIVPNSAKLTVALAGVTTTAAAVDLADKSKKLLVTDIGNVASSIAENTITYTFGPSAVGGMVGFTGTNADGTPVEPLTVTYTLEEA